MGRAQHGLRGRRKCGTINSIQLWGEDACASTNQGIWTGGRGRCRRHLERGGGGGRRLPADRAADPGKRPYIFSGQTFTGLAYDAQTGETVGLYILHPNNVGRCGHICNASYAVKNGLRGQHIGEALVRHCMAQAKAQGFGILQFNAVVRTNLPALRLYEKLGFVPLGIIPGGFRMKDGAYEISSRIIMSCKRKG